MYVKFLYRIELKIGIIDIFRNIQNQLRRIYQGMWFSWKKLFLKLSYGSFPIFCIHLRARENLIGKQLFSFTYLIPSSINRKATERIRNYKVKLKLDNTDELGCRVCKANIFRYFVTFLPCFWLGYFPENTG